MLSLVEDQTGCRLAVRVQPNARRTDLAGLQGVALKIALQAPAVEGKANQALVDFLARLLGLSRSSVTLVSGEKSRNKTVHLAGITAADVLSRLGASGALPTIEPNGTDPS